MGVDVLDLADLQRRGLLRIPKSEETSEVMDLTLPSPQPTVSQGQTESPPQDTSSAFDFLSGFAQASAPPPSNLPMSTTSSDVHSKLDTIINKIEDTMYKIEVLSGRVAQLEARFGR